MKSTRPLLTQHGSGQKESPFFLLPPSYQSQGKKGLRKVCKPVAKRDKTATISLNIDAFKKAENIINQAQDRLNGETAMGFIQNTHPIVIIDEPQSVDNTPKAKEAIATLNPLCVLRYSATHREKINLRATMGCF